MSAKRELGFSTVAVHGKKHLDKHEAGKAILSVSTPIFMSSTFAFESADHGARLFAGQEEGYIYTRIGNPTTQVLEKEIAYLEGAEVGQAFASGMAAEAHTMLALAKAGDRIVSGDTIYGGTHKLWTRLMPKLGIEVVEVDVRDPKRVEAALDDRTCGLFFETPSNPSLGLADIEQLAAIAHKRKVPVIIDNTFATPYLQNPIRLGADLVLHSATKYIGGHGDCVSGLVVGNKELMGRVAEVAHEVGGIISPFNAWLLLRGLKTLPVRMDRHCDNAMEVAKFLSFHPQVEWVSYPGLKTHPQHELAKRQMRGFSGVIAFEIKGGRPAGKRFLDSLELCTVAVSLGDCDTLIQHPASMTHSTYTAEELAAAGISEGMIRLSVGLEDVDDIIADLRTGFARLKS
jgi:methionine-gamma-lyase